MDLRAVVVWLGMSFPPSLSFPALGEESRSELILLSGLDPSPRAGMIVLLVLDPRLRGDDSFKCLLTPIIVKPFS